MGETPPGTVNVHTISPGMVFTKLLLDDSTPELRKFPFGVLAAQPEEVGEDLVPKILATTGQGTAVEFLTTDKVLFKFYQKFVEGKKSEFIDDDGNVIKVPGRSTMRWACASSTMARRTTSSSTRRRRRSQGERQREEDGIRWRGERGEPS